jgi:dipeptidyl aminopeptidase/acylaminoacyl peptidase
MYPRRLLPAAVLLAAVPSYAGAQEFELTIPNIMRGADLIGEAPQGLRGGGFAGPVFDWSPDGRYVYFQWRKPGVDTALVPYRVAADGGEPERITEREADSVLAGLAEWTRDGRRALYVVDGDVVVWERGKRRRLTRTVAREGSAKWSADESHVFFERDGNVFAEDLATGEVEQLTDIRRGADPDEDKPVSEQRQFLRDQEKRLFEFIGDEHFKKQPWFRQSERDSTRPQPFYPGANASVQSLDITPDGRFALLTVVERARNARAVDMPVWITPDGYVDVEAGRTKVGDEQVTVRAAILDVTSGNVTYVGDSVGTGERNVRGVAVSPNSRHALLRVETKDDKDRWYAVVDVVTKDIRIVDHLHDSAWVAGPSYTTAGFMPDGETVYFVSERTGWAHLYTAPATGGTATALTSGEWEVLQANLSHDGATWYITANRDGFADVHFYTLPARGGDLQRITDAQGRQDVTVSPDGRWLAMQHSEANKPPELYLQENRPGRATPRQITVSTTEEWRSYDWIKPEIVTVTARDGVGIPARLYRPKGTVAPAGRRPAVIFVHGAGYLQNVHNWWSSYYREYMFHHVLATAGYTVLDMDYRGSAGHGRDWRTAIYEHMGGKDLTDQVDGAHWLTETMGVDPERIGIYGGSYGGFITLMAMFTTPGVFEAGAALRPVTDWAHYNHGYTSNILNEPQNDSLAYERSSPIYFAEGLLGHLLIAHGMVDDNVHFSDTVRLVQRLIELGKDNWEVAIYPAERHGFTEPSSWTDEYKRIFNLFENTLK